VGERDNEPPQGGRFGALPPRFFGRLEEAEQVINLAAFLAVAVAAMNGSVGLPMSGMPVWSKMGPRGTWGSGNRRRPR
jgi:hypothetical protein